MRAVESLMSRIQAGEVIIMDGGTGTEIRRRGVSLGKKTWSGEPLLTSPDTIREIHEDYIQAGADIIITNTFSTSRAKLAQGGLSDHASDLNRLAQEARENVESDYPVTIAGSMSTFLPMNDPNVIPSYEVALADYREQAYTLAEAGVDLLVGEMLIRTLDAVAFVEAATETGLPIWVGYSCQNQRGRQYLGVEGNVGKETIPEAVAAVESKGIAAMFIMHSLPEDTGPGLRELSQCTSLPFGAYAHIVRRSTKDMANLRDDMSEAIVADPGLPPDEYLQLAREWAELGAQIIGGCCGTTPEHIKSLKDGLQGESPYV